MKFLKKSVSEIYKNFIFHPAWTLSIATADVTVNSRRRSSGGLRRNASHDITDQITDRKLLDLKKVGPYL